MTADELWKRHGIRLVSLASIEPESNRWLWHGRIPLGMLTVIDGDPDLGKSMITIDIAARVSTGRPMPGETDAGEASDAIFVSTEDHPAMTHRPRFAAAAADLSRVHLVQAMQAEDGADDSPILTTKGIQKLEAAITARGARFVVVDPIANYLPASVDSHRDQDVRSVLRPLANVAARTGAAIVLIRHLTKGFGSALYRGAGSIGIAGAARSVLTVKRLDDDWREISSTKCNIAGKVQPCRYRLVEAAGAARVEWGAGPDNTKRERRASKRELERREKELTALRVARDQSGVNNARLASALGTSKANASRLQPILAGLVSRGLLGQDDTNGLRPLTALGIEDLIAAGM